MSKHTRWFLVSSSGLNIPLNQTMILFGKEGSDVVLQSRSVDKRHAVLTFDHYENCFKVKDLNTANGSYLNDIRIPSQTFIKLEHLDSLRFGFDLVVYQVQAVEQIPVPPQSSNYQYCVWENGKLSHHPIYYPAQVVKMTDCKECLHKLTGQHHTCDSYNVAWSKDPLTQQHHNYPNQDRNLPSTTYMDGPKDQFPVFSSVCDKEDLRSSVLPPVHRAHPEWGMDQIVQRSHDGTMQSVSEEKPRGQSTVENKVYCQGNYAPPFYNCYPGVIQQNDHRIGPQLGTTDMTSSIKVGAVNNSTISSDVELIPNMSQNGSGTAANCLQCNFSGDSLDLNQGDTAVGMQKNVGEVELRDRKSIFNSESDPGRKSTIHSNSQKDINTSLAKSDLPSPPAPENTTVESNLDQTLESGSCPLNIGNNGLSASDEYQGFQEASPSSTIKDGGNNKTARLNCTAFTIDFTDVCAPSSSSKKLGIKDKISKFAPQKTDSESKASHRKTPGLPKSHNETERKKSTGSYNLHEELESPTAGVITAARAKLEMAGGGYLSDGHGSSDQDDSVSAKSDPVKKIEVDGVQIARADLFGKTKSMTTKRGRALPVVGLRDSAKYLIGKMFGQVTAPTNSPTEPSSPPLLQKGDRHRTWINENNVTGLSSGGVKGNVKKVNHAAILNTGSNVHGVNKLTKPTMGSSDIMDLDTQRDICRNEDDDDEEGVKDSAVVCNGGEQNVRSKEDDEGGDSVSEAGTYTIENDRENDEETLARKNIDVVFGVTGNQPSAVNLQRPVVVSNIEGKHVEQCEAVDIAATAAVVPQSAINEKEHAGWLKDWVSKTVDGGGRKIPPLAESQLRNASAAPGAHSPYEANARVVPRQRRRLPIPPVNRYTVTMDDPINDAVTLQRDRLWASSSSASDSPEGQHSDGSMDTETILKETETVVSAMEARIDHCRKDVDIIDVESRDSGGESDVDTSTASTRNESVAKIRDPLVPNGKVRGWREKSDQNLTENNFFNASVKSNRRHCGKSFASGTTENDYNYHSEGETASVHSDVSSSSDLSGSSPGSRRKGGSASAVDIDKPPLMRFNRAFSLRRARLGCDADGGTSKTSASSLASSRPSSAGSTSSAKDGIRGSVTCSRNEPQVVVKSSSGGGPFDRSDGGRFSLRLPRGPPVLSRMPGKGTSSGKRHDRSSVNQNVTLAKTATTVTPRSNSTLSAKELEMKNWKRRKEYDPLKAAAEGRKKDAAKKVGQVGSPHSEALHKSDVPTTAFNAFQRSASFHGTDGLAQLNSLDYKSEDDLGLRSSNGNLHPTLPLDRRQTITLSHRSSGVGGGHVGRNHQESRFERKKNPEDDLSPELGKNVGVAATMPLESGCYQMVDSLTRHQSKIEALDNLVISTVHQVSRNLCSNVEDILKTLGRVHGQECQYSLGDNGLEELLCRVGIVSSPETSPRGHSVSKQLSGILKNMKCLEESLQAINSVLSTVPSANNFQKDNGKNTQNEGIIAFHKRTSFPA